MIDLMEATGPGEARGALRWAWAQKSEQGGDLALGFLWLEHKRGDFDLVGLLDRAGEWCDTHHGDQDAFFSLAQECERRGESAEIRTKAERLFGGCITSATEGYGRLVALADEVGAASAPSPDAQGAPSWSAFDEGRTVGHHGSEDGVIVRDEEHKLGARITLERDASNAPFAITCGIYGWMFHTRYFGSEERAAADFERMKLGLAQILHIIPLKDDPESRVKMRAASDAIAAFVERFP